MDAKTQNAVAHQTCNDCGGEVRQWHGMDGVGWKCIDPKCGLLMLLTRGSS